MIILTDKLPKEGLGISKDFEFSSSELVDENAVLLQPTNAELEVRKSGEEVLIKGNIKTCISLICSRCLVPYKFSVDVKCDLIYLPEELDELKEELRDSDMDNFFYRDREINIRGIVLEQLNLSFPVKPLCSEECKGICPVCGKNQKFDKCDCSMEDTDPRLQKLRTFIKNRQ